jgi:hypothetical protein
LLIAVLTAVGTGLGVAYAAGSPRSVHPAAAHRAAALTGSLWGVINEDGTIVRQNGAIKSVNNDSTGHYDITLSRNVSGCAVSGMTGDNTPGANSGGAYPLAYAWETTTVLDIKIYNPDAFSNISHDFSFVVTC